MYAKTVLFGLMTGLSAGSGQAELTTKREHAEIRTLAEAPESAKKMKQ